MMRMMQYIVFVIMLTYSYWCQAQDHIHFAQYQWIPAYQNPAFSGQDKNYDMSYGLIYRDQSFTVSDNAYKSIMADINYNRSIFKQQTLGISMILADDKAGDGGLHTTLVGLSPSLRWPINDRSSVSIGGHGIWIQRRYDDLGAFILEEELQNGVTTEQILNDSKSYLDYGLGLGYEQTFDESVLTAGLSMFHGKVSPTTEPDYVDRYPRKYNIHAEYLTPLNSQFWLQPKIQHVQSSQYKVTQVQALLRFKTNKRSDYILIGGAGWRISDALQLHLGLEYKSWAFGFVYENNTSGLRAASGNVAALEMAIRYRHQIPEKELPDIVPELPMADISVSDSITLLFKVPTLLRNDSIPIKISYTDIVEDSITTSDDVHIELKNDRSYEFIITAPGYVPDTLNISPLSTVPPDIIEYEISLEKVETPKADTIPKTVAPEPPQDSVIYIDEVIVLDKIFYDFDDDYILPESEEELRPLLEIMLQYPTMKIELSSHTDVRGSDAYNIWLSQKRAASAKTWLVERGIAEDRIIAKGYGETRLTNHCDDGVPCSEALHRKNRRTEFKIIEGPKSVRYRKSEN